MRARSIVLAAVVVALAPLAGCNRHTDATGADTPAKVAPGFAGATAWLNVDHAITMEELRGKVVVVDFWTSCCINCIQTLPVLADVERAYAGKPVAVIGVHSAKFDAEKEADRLREIVSEYSISHPIAVDGSMRIWNAWGVAAWPTVFVLDASGGIVWSGSGEPKREAISAAIDAALDRGAKAGALQGTPLKGLRHEVADSGPLAFPGKVIVLADGSFAVSDTGHHRVVFLGADGEVVATVGSGLAGFTDGAFGEASFRKPEGLTEAGDLVYVADTENHAVRAIDRRAHTVTTVAGTGELGAMPLTGRTPARTTKLRSPWDLVQVNGTVYVALAGSHQIAALRPSDGTIEAFVGDGEERRLDGAGMAASFAQPSGITTDGTSLYVADSESSSIRAVDLATRDVRTLVGQDLFVFGDVDGPAPRVRLEHPIGVAYGAGALWVADTYNSKIKRLDLSTAVTTTFLGGRNHAALYEPEGLFVHGSDLVVADTKHHRIDVLGIDGSAPHPLAIRGLSVPSVGVALDVARPNTEGEPHISLGEVPLAATGSSTVHFDWKTPAGTGINEEAPFRLDWTSSDGLASVPSPIKSTGATVQHGFDLSLTPIAGAAAGKLTGELSVVLCDVTTHLVCVPVRRSIELGFRAASVKGESPTVLIPLPEAKP